MIRRRTLVVVVGLALLWPLLGRAGEAAPHPRLFLPARAELLSTLRTASPHHAAAWKSLVDRVDRGLSAYSGRPGYAASSLAREAGLAYQVTRDERYAALAWRTLMDSRREHEDQPDRGYGLSRAMMCLGYALAYDWCYSAWSADQRQQVLQVLRAAADAWPEFHHANVESAHKGSNWVGVTRGGELLLHLAARGDGDYGSRDDRIQLCLADLGQHLVTAYGESGWTQEGPGYLEYTAGFLLPALQAASEAGYTTRPRPFATIPWHRLASMSFSFREGHNFLQSGVSGPQSSDEGFASLAWLGVPPANQAAYRFFYDRHLGVRALRPTFDGHRAGTVWALLFYPPGSESRAPTAAPLFDHGKGAYFFRNRWQDRDDVLVSLMTRADQHSHAWQQPETWQIALIAFDTTFAGGPVKERDPSLYSKLLINGRTESLPARPGAHELSATASPSGGGVVESDAAENFGLHVAHRRFEVDFAPTLAGAAAVIRIDDRLENDTAFTAAFQLCPEPGVAIAAIPAANGAPAGFVLRGRNGWVRGWVKSPTDARIVTSGALRVETSRASTHGLSIVLAIGQGELPERVP